MKLVQRFTFEPHPSVHELPEEGNHLSNFWINSWKLATNRLWKFSSQGSQELPANQNFIFCPNHVSNMDIFFVRTCLPKNLQKRLYCLSKEENFQNTFLSFWGKNARAIPIKRSGSAAAQATKIAENVLNQGNSILMHPEGTRSRTGELYPFKTGAAYVSILTGVPLVPVKIIGPAEFYPPTRKLPKVVNLKTLKKYQLTVLFGEPLFPPTQVPESKRNLEAKKLTELLRERVIALGDPNAEVAP